MNGIALVLILASAMGGTSSISGHVVGPSGTPVSGARVFIEPGITGDLRETSASTDGAFRFDDVTPGGVGVFAVGDGLSFGGAHVTVALADAVSGVNIHLCPPDVVRGKVCDQKGHPVAGARITGAGLLGEAKVGIPLVKLGPLGFTVPESDGEGRFEVRLLPERGTVSLKVTHPAFAQEGVNDVAVGGKDIQVTMYKGVLTRGSVLSRSGAVPVVNAAIIFRNAQPPFDTVLTRSDSRGTYSAMLKPGVYAYQVESARHRTPGWIRLDVLESQPEQEVKMYVVGTGEVYGEVLDAVSEKPIAGARLVLEAQGHRADVTYTGPSGKYRLVTTEGENVVQVDSAPGYAPSQSGPLRRNIEPGAATEMPTLWLAPIPTYTVQILDSDLKPVPHAVVSLLRPAQFGWHVADEEGHVSLNVGVLPPDGALVGLAEHPARAQGALFRLKIEDRDGATVQLLPLGETTGRVVSSPDKGLEGAVVQACFVEDSPGDPVTLWRTVARQNGVFAWQSVVPRVPQVCVVETSEGGRSRSSGFNPEAEQAVHVGDVTIAEGKAGISLYGKPLRWYDQRPQAGPPLDEKAVKSMPALIMYCGLDQAPMVIEALSAVRQVPGKERMTVAAVVDGPYSSAAPMPVLRGKSPAIATTYLVDTDGKVILETFGMPPLTALQRLTERE